MKVAKVKETRIVQTIMTKAELENRGMQRYTNKTLRRTYLVIALMLFAAIGLSFWRIEAFGFMVFAIFGYWLVWYGKANRKGREYWVELKDKPEPIVLEK